MGLKAWLQAWLLEDLEGEVKQLRLELKELNDRLTRLESRLEDQDKTIQEVLLSLDKKADKGLYYELSDRLEVARDELEELREAIEKVSERLKYLEFSASEKSVSEDMSVEELANVVEFYIRKGFTRPSELQRQLGVSWEKLYSALYELMARKRIKRIKKGRRTEYVLIVEGD